MSGTPLCKQFALQEAFAGMGLQVRVSRTPEWNVLKMPDPTLQTIRKAQNG